MDPSLEWLLMVCPSDDFDGKYFVSGALLQAASTAEWVSWSVGSLIAIAFLAVDGWRAFQKKQHWIPCDSFLLGALTLLLLTLLNMPSSILNFPKDDILPLLHRAFSPNFHQDDVYIVNNILFCPQLVSRKMLVLSGRVSLCVVLGCMLPGLARPRSSTLTLWTDMAALIITCSPSIFHLSNEIYVTSDYIDWQTLVVTITVLVAFVILILLLICAALTSISIHKIVSHKIPLILSTNSTAKINLSASHSCSESFWERVEEQIVKSWIVVCTSNPQYILARSVLSPSIAMVITVCNAILVYDVIRMEFKVSIHMIIHWLVILLGSVVIYWRCITAVVFFPRSVEMQRTSIKKYFQIEDFWKRYLLELKDGHKSHRQLGDSYLKILMLKLGRRVRVHKLIPMVLWFQILLVRFSKACWLVSQLLISNIGLHKFIHGGKGEFEIELGKFSYNDKYSKAFVTMNGENVACLWVANKKCIQGIKAQMERGQKEGNSCKALIGLIKKKSFGGYKNQHLQKSSPIRSEVKNEFAICTRSCKMRTVSIITILFELFPFTQDVKKAIGAVEACSQAWSIMDLVENSNVEDCLVSKEADKLFQDLLKKNELLCNHFGMSTSVENSSDAAKEAVRNLVEKAQNKAEEWQFRTWSEVVEGYSLWKVCENIDFEKFMKVEGIMDELVNMLADEIGVCMAKVLDVIMDDTLKWATMAMEQHIWEAAYVVGKVKSITDHSRWTLTCNPKGAIKNASTSCTEFSTLKKCSSFQIG